MGIQTKQSKHGDSKQLVRVRSHALCEVNGHHIPLLSLPYPSQTRKRYLFSHCWVDRVFQSWDGEARVLSHDPPAIFCTTTILPLNYGASPLRTHARTHARTHTHTHTHTHSYIHTYIINRRKVNEIVKCSYPKQNVNSNGKPHEQNRRSLDVGPSLVYISKYYK